jgi:Skp family chaperone for outer membrane proteins
VIEELRAARPLIKDQADQIGRLEKLNSLEVQVSTGLKDLRILDAEQKAELWKAIDAANREIAALKGANAVLKKNQVTVWKKIKWFVLGGAVGIVAGTILTHE